MDYFLHALSIIVQALIWVIIIRVLLSWFSAGAGGTLRSIINVLDQIVEPILAPLRRVVPSVGMFDITPMVAVLLLFGIRQVLALLLRS